MQKSYGTQGAEERSDVDESVSMGRYARSSGV